MRAERWAGGRRGGHACCVKSERRFTRGARLGGAVGGEGAGGPTQRAAARRHRPPGPAAPHRPCRALRQPARAGAACAACAIGRAAALGPLTLPHPTRAPLTHGEPSHSASCCDGRLQCPGMCACLCVRRAGAGRWARWVSKGRRWGAGGMLCGVRLGVAKSSRGGLQNQVVVGSGASGWVRHEPPA